MPIFKPFRGVRPHPDYIDVFPTHPLESFSEEEITKKAAEDSSYIQMIKPYVCSKSKDVDRNLRKIRANYEEMLQDNKLLQDPSSYYLYSQILPDRTVYRGLLGLVHVEDFWDGKIKMHESTFEYKKEKFAHYLDKVNLQAEPVLLTYPANSKVELLMNFEEKNVPIINYVSDNGIRHKVWRIDNRLKLQQFKEVLDHVENFFVADGHHRIASTALNAREHKEKNRKHNGTETYNYVFSYLVSNQSIKIHDYNRLLPNLKDISSEKFLERLDENFLIHEKGDVPYFPSQKFHISMYLDGKYYSLHVKHHLRSLELGLDSVDHYLLEKYIFKEILNYDEKEISEITYLSGNSRIEGIKELKEKVDSGDFAVGFGLYPVSFNDLVKIANQNLRMPPKCTYIEPKLVTALLMYDMK